MASLATGGIVTVDGLYTVHKFTEASINFIIGATASASTSYAGYPASAGNDGTTAIWASGTTGVQWWKCDLGAGVTKTARKFRVQQQQSSGGHGIKDFTLSGSNDDSNWTPIYTSQAVDGADLSWEEFNFPNAVAYRYYKFDFPNTWRPDGYVSAREFELYVVPQDSIFIPIKAGEVEVLVVAGGGAGGCWTGGGGGAGGVIEASAHAVTPQEYSVQVGAGAPRNLVNANGLNGENSWFDSLIAIGGGGGAGYSPNESGSNGGSGGGNAHGAVGAVGLGTVGQGNNGGIGDNATSSSGGGGGAGAVGGSTTGDGTGGTGGIGIQSAIDGTLKYYGGGGGGWGFTAKGVGGLGGGGDSDYNELYGDTATNGAVNTGGGGGGGWYQQYSCFGGGGGSGVVVIRYLTADQEGGLISFGMPMYKQV